MAPTGLEPVLSCEKRILSPSRLPIPPGGRGRATNLSDEVRLRQMDDRSVRLLGLLRVGCLRRGGKFREELRGLLLELFYARLAAELDQLIRRAIDVQDRVAHAAEFFVGDEALF